MHLLRLLHAALVAALLVCGFWQPLRAGGLSAAAQFPQAVKAVNLWYAPLLAADAAPNCRARLAAELDSLQALGVNAVQVLAGTEFSARTDTSLTRGVEFNTLVAKERALRALDFTLGELAKRRMQAIVCLAREMPADAEGQTRYERFVRKLLSRKSSLDGTPLAQSPAVLAWLTSDCPHTANADTLLLCADWALRQAQLIRACGAEQTVALPYVPLGREGGDEQLLSRCFQSGSVGAVCVMLSPCALGWVGKGELVSGMAQVYLRSEQLIATCNRIALQAGKPLLLMRVEYPRSGGFTHPGAGTQARDTFLGFVASQLQQAADDHQPLCGAIVNGWGGGISQQGDEWRNPNDFSAEYPDERKGAFSIFATDRSTLDILRQLSPTP